jgi:hypothetical protein
MDLEKLIESHYAPKKGQDLLIKLIESKLNEQFGTDELTLAVGAGKSEFREEYDKLLTTPIYTSITSERYFSNRLDTIKKYLSPKGRQDLRTDEFIATFVFLQEFDKILREYEGEDPRQAGFKFETLFTVLFRGVQINGSDITDAEILEPRAFARFSYKFYSINRRLRLDGSLHNLLRMMAEGKDVVYFVCLKNPPNFKFYSFLVQPENFYKILKKSTDIYRKYFTDFQPQEGLEGTQLAASMLEHMRSKFGTAKAETSTELFDATFLNQIYNLSQLNTNLSEYNNIRCSYEGEIDISTKIIFKAKLEYKDLELGRVGKLLEDANKLNKKMLIFFASPSAEDQRQNIIDTIQDIDGTFKDITKG